MSESIITFAAAANKTAPVSKVYQMPWGEFCEVISSHKPAADKNAVAGWLPADIDPGPRKGERVKAITALVMDIEGRAEGTGEDKHLVGPAAPEISELALDISLHGWAAVLASSYSHKTGDLGPRYRVIFPLTRHLTKDELKTLLWHVADLLGLHECLDPASADAARLYYLPTCPADRLELAERQKVGGEPLDVDTLLAQVSFIKANNKLPKRKQDPAKLKTFADRVRFAFNQQADIGHILETHGYKSDGRGKWQCPNSTSGMHGVNRLGGADVIWSHHTSDVLHGKAHDAFGVWCALEHGDDFRRALYAAALMLGIEAPSEFKAGIVSLDEMVERFVFRSHGACVYHRARPREPLTWNDFVKTYQASRTGDKPTSQVWLADPRRLTVSTETFLAGGDEFVKCPMGTNAINSWGTGFCRDDSGDAALAQPFVDHVRYLFAERADNFLDWLAHIEQRPGELPHSGWLHVSGGLEGTGRGWLVELLTKVFEGFVQPEVDLPRLLENNFNAELSRKVLAIVPEIKDAEGSSGLSAKVNSERMKTLLTAHIRNINEKHMAVRQEFNAARWWVCSNHENAMPLSMTDRRFSVVLFKGKVREPEYYQRLYALLDDPVFIQSVAKWFQARDLSKFNPGAPPPMTEDKRRVLFEVQSSPTQTLIEWAETYAHPLALGEHFQNALGITPTAANAKALNYAIRSAGWTNLKDRYLLNGKKVRVYCRVSDQAGFVGKIPNIQDLIGEL